MTDPVLAIGPANYAGQAQAWAEAVEDFLPAKAWSFTKGPLRRGGFAFPASVTVPALRFHTPLCRRSRSKRLFKGTTHIALDGYQPYFRALRKKVFGRDARWLQEQGFTLALIAHGTDVRDPDHHQERDRWSYFNEGSEEWRRHLRDFAARNRGYADALGMPLFVSTPDLLIDQPQATWLPLRVDLRAWESNEPVFARKIPRILHIPSRRNPPIKGTQYIDPVMERLVGEGLAEYVSPDTVSHADMPALVRSCDIVVDQVLTGSYGVAAVEAMAAGRVVIGRVAPDVRALMTEAPGIIDADPDTLEDVLRHVLTDVDAAQTSIQGNLEFVRKWHDGRATAKALASFLGVSAG